MFACGRRAAREDRTAGGPGLELELSAPMLASRTREWPRGRGVVAPIRTSLAGAGVGAVADRLTIRPGS
jgi:hypothetical protein